MDIWSIIGKAVSALGGTAVFIAIIGAIARWMGSRWAERLYLKWKLEADQSLEELRSELATQRDLLDSAVAAAARGHLVAQERTLDAIEALWDTVIKMDTAIYEKLSLYDVVSCKTYREFLTTKPEFGEFLPSDMTGIAAVFRPFTGDEIEHSRPYLGEKLWALFFAYRAFLMRVFMKVALESKAGKVYPWDRDERGNEDTHLLEMLKRVCEPEELEPISVAETGALRMMRTLFTQKILLEIGRRISGKHIGEISLEDGARLREVLLSAQEVEQTAREDWLPGLDCTPT